MVGRLPLFFAHAMLDIVVLAVSHDVRERSLRADGATCEFGVDHTGQCCLTLWGGISTVCVNRKDGGSSCEKNEDCNSGNCNREVLRAHVMNSTDWGHDANNTGHELKYFCKLQRCSDVYDYDLETYGVASPLDLGKAVWQSCSSNFDCNFYTSGCCSMNTDTSLSVLSRPSAVDPPVESTFWSVSDRHICIDTLSMPTLKFDYLTKVAGASVFQLCMNDGLLNKAALEINSLMSHGNAPSIKEAMGQMPMCNHQAPLGEGDDDKVRLEACSVLGKYFEMHATTRNVLLGPGTRDKLAELKEDEMWQSKFSACLRLPPSPPPASPPPPAVLLPSATRYTGEELLSTMAYHDGQQLGHVALIMQGDGNLVLYYYPKNKAWRTVLWAANENGMQGDPIENSVFVFQDDGNLVIYKSGCTGYHCALWSSSTNHKCVTNCQLVLQGDCNLVLYSLPDSSEDRKVHWSTSTSGKCKEEEGKR